MTPKEIIDKIWHKVQKFRYKNEGESPFCILLDPHTVYNIEANLDVYPSLKAEWTQSHGGALFGIKVFIPKQWDANQGRIIEVR